MTLKETNDEELAVNTISDYSDHPKVKKSWKDFNDKFEEVKKLEGIGEFNY